MEEIIEVIVDDYNNLFEDEWLSIDESLPKEEQLRIAREQMSCYEVWAKHWWTRDVYEVTYSYSDVYCTLLVTELNVDESLFINP